MLTQSRLSGRVIMGYRRRATLLSFWARS